MKRTSSITITLLVVIMFTAGCGRSVEQLAVEGVSKELAQNRYSHINDVEYNLHFEIPEQKDEPVTATLSLLFVTNVKEAVVLDFKQSDSSVKSVKANGNSVKFIFKNEHIVIPESSIKEGKNTIDIVFVAGDQSLNRREDLMYTLLVPDRARTLFPCFDQPDIKSRYKLSLEIPLEWDAVANGKVENRDTLDGAGRVSISFSLTEPIPTYLFSFVAGKMSKVTQKLDGRPVSIYYRETDPAKIAQCDEIFRQIFSALKWLEDYTEIPYPFTKYDIVIIPGFQYGGMEHMGATLYADRTMFLDHNATISEKLARAELIAHETAHMWFGDYVTMKWFDEVWTKEVFANWFASKIVTPLFPEVNHGLSFLNNYFPAAYSEDRTSGATPVRQDLDNLNNAGLVYGNIIYNKAPIVMDMLVRKIGGENFKKGMRTYLKKYAYSNATWDDLIEILDGYTDEDLKGWSHVWINEPGMPEISATVIGDSVVTTCYDNLGRDITWEQPLKYDIINGVPVPDTDGHGYGAFILDDKSSSFILGKFASYEGIGGKPSLIDNEITRCSLLITLYENLLRKKITAEQFCETLTEYLPKEQNPLILSRGMGYLSSAYTMYLYSDKSQKSMEIAGKAEEMLWKMILDDNDMQHKTIAYRVYTEIVNSKRGVDRLYKIWENPEEFKSIKLGERDLTNLSYTLMLHIPEEYSAIKDRQLGRITNQDRKNEYRFIVPSLSLDSSVRDSVFKSLLKEENRSVEPWAASALGFLNHYTRDLSSLKYIEPGLEELIEVQRTGDIFFPRNWLKSLLSGHNSTEAAKIVKDFIAKNKDYPPMLKKKILQQADHLLR